MMFFIPKYLGYLEIVQKLNALAGMEPEMAIEFMKSKVFKNISADMSKDNKVRVNEKLLKLPEYKAQYEESQVRLSGIRRFLAVFFIQLIVLLAIGIWLS